MCGRKSYKRFAGLGVAIVLFAGLGVAIVLFSGRPGDLRKAKPITADLVTAIRNADAQAVRKLLENGADVNARDAEGNTPLILASFYASPECLALLIENGADVNAANKAGATPLIRAATDYEKTRLLAAAERTGPTPASFRSAGLAPRWSRSLTVRELPVRRAANINGVLPRAVRTWMFAPAATSKRVFS